MNQSELEANTRSRRQARETHAGRESGARFFSQSQTVAMQNQSNCVVTFDTQL